MLTIDTLAGTSGRRPGVVLDALRQLGRRSRGLAIPEVRDAGDGVAVTVRGTAFRYWIHATRLGDSPVAEGVVVETAEGVCVEGRVRLSYSNAIGALLWSVWGVGVCIASRSWVFGLCGLPMVGWGLWLTVFSRRDRYLRALHAVLADALGAPAGEAESVEGTSSARRPAPPPGAARFPA